MRLLGRKKTNLIKLPNDVDFQLEEQSDSSRNKETIVSEASSELKLLTRRHSLTASRSISMIRSKKEKKVITFTAIMDSIDGIIATNHGRQSLIGQRNQPVFVVVSYYKKIMSTGKTVKTNMLSLPLVKSNSSIGKRVRLYAKFSDEDHPQTFSLSAAMRRDSSYKSGYEPRELDVEISLMRGSEVVKLGSTAIVLSGDEDGSMQIVAVNSSKAITNTVRKAMIANKPSKTSVSSLSTTTAKMVSFASDPSCKYTLQRSILRFSVLVKGTNKSQSQYLEDTSNMPSSMILSVGNSDSVSCLSSGGVTSDIFKERPKKTNHSYEDDIGENFRKMQTLNTTSTDLNMSLATTRTRDDDFTLDESDASEALCKQNQCFGNDLMRLSSDNSSSDNSSSDSNNDTDGERELPSYDESNGKETLSEDESALLDEVSIGTIKFKEIEPSDGFEVISKIKDHRML